LHVEELARSVDLRTSTFHQHFRALTAMSPLQHQKWLRLNEARRLMLVERECRFRFILGRLREPLSIEP